MKKFSTLFLLLLILPSSLLSYHSAVFAQTLPLPGIADSQPSPVVSAETPTPPSREKTSGKIQPCRKDASGQFLLPGTDPYQYPPLKTLLAKQGDKRTVVDDAWCIALAFEIPPVYFLSQIYAESFFLQVGSDTDPGGGDISYGLVQITKDDLQSGYLNQCMFKVLSGKEPPDCTDGSTDFGGTSTSAAKKNFGGAANALRNLIAGGRIMLMTVLDNLPKGASASDSSSSDFKGLNPVTQACAAVNYVATVNVRGLSDPVDCMQLYAKALVAYNGGTDVVSGDDNGDPYPGCQDEKKSASWLMCIYHEQDHRFPDNPNDGGHTDTYFWQHEAAHYVANIMYSYLTTTLGCNEDAKGNRFPIKEPICLAEVKNWPNNAIQLLK